MSLWMFRQSRYCWRVQRSECSVAPQSGKKRRLQYFQKKKETCPGWPLWWDRLNNWDFHVGWAGAVQDRLHWRAGVTPGFLPPAQAFVHQHLRAGGAAVARLDLRGNASVGCGCSSLHPPQPPTNQFWTRPWSCPAKLMLMHLLRWNYSTAPIYKNLSIYKIYKKYP